MVGLGFGAFGVRPNLTPHTFNLCACHDGIGESGTSYYHVGGMQGPDDVTLL
jgi:hypothetical protein